MIKMLLVEDEVMIREPFGMVLKTQPFKVDLAANGLEALEYCSKNTYDLILLDLMMPFCSGVEFLKKASLKTKSPNTKVILLTNLAQGKEIDEALALGAEKSILKASMTPKALLELVGNELNSSSLPHH